MSEIPRAVIQAVRDTNDLIPAHPPFARGCVAHFLAHKRIAEYAPSGTYIEDHSASQCRGSIILSEHNKRFTVILASAEVDTIANAATVHRKGRMTHEASRQQPRLDGMEDIFVVDLETESLGEGAFFILVERFLLPPNKKKIRCYLVWGKLVDSTTVKFDHHVILGEDDLPPEPVLPLDPIDLPPVSDSTPFLEFLD